MSIDMLMLMLASPSVRRDWSKGLVGEGRRTRETLGDRELRLRMGDLRIEGDLGIWSPLLWLDRVRLKAVDEGV